MGRAAGPEVTHKLTPEAQKLLQPVLGRYGVDLSKMEFRFGWTPKGVGAYTVGNRVVINQQHWGSLSGLGRLELVGHEATHTAQYARLGTAGFLSRYAGEYGRPGNYDWPGGPMPSNPIDSRFTLDQIATRTELEIRARYGP
jgi:hypothetical protein